MRGRKKYPPQWWIDRKKCCVNGGVFVSKFHFLVSNTVFGLRESGRIDCGRKESTETNILPPFGCFDREERKFTVYGSHS
jgi:hypothetical protein